MQSNVVRKVLVKAEVGSGFSLRLSDMSATECSEYYRL